MDISSISSFAVSLLLDAKEFIVVLLLLGYSLHSKQYSKRVPIIELSVLWLMFGLSWYSNSWVLLLVAMATLLLQYSREILYRLGNK